MADYVYIENYTRNGAMGISHVVFYQIAEAATNVVKGAAVSKSKGRLFNLHRPIVCHIRNGQVNVDIAVSISKATNINEVCLKIQEEVASALSSMTELVPFNINIKVANIE